jgi:hypothetical protein
MNLECIEIKSFFFCSEEDLLSCCIPHLNPLFLCPFDLDHLRKKFFWLSLTWISLVIILFLSVKSMMFLHDFFIFL